MTVTSPDALREADLCISAAEIVLSAVSVSLNITEAEPFNLIGEL